MIRNYILRCSIISIHASKMGNKDDDGNILYILSGTKLIRLKRLLLIIGNIEQKVRISPCQHPQ